MRRGFTMVELMVVMALIAILAAVLLAGVFGGKEGAEIAATKQSMNAFGMILVEAYNNDRTDLLTALNLGVAPGTSRYIPGDTAQAYIQADASTIKAYLTSKGYITDDKDACDAWQSPLRFGIDRGSDLTDTNDDRLYIYSIGPNMTENGGAGKFGLTKVDDERFDDIGISFEL